MSTLAVPPKASFARTFHAEWIKFRSLRSTWYTLIGLVVIGLGITALSMDAVGAGYAAAGAEEQEAWDPTARSLMAYILAQLVIGVLGILVVTSEYATGLMQTTLIATPRRTRLLAAKAVLVAVVAFVAGQALMFASFLLGQGLLSAQDVPSARLGDPGVLSAVVGGGVYLTAIALLAAALGTIMRATAGAIATLVAIVFLVPAVSPLLPSWLHGVLAYWPSLGGPAVIATVPDPAFPHPWMNLGGMYLGVAVVLAVAFVVFQRRDV